MHHEHIISYCMYVAAVYWCIFTSTNVCVCIHCTCTYDIQGVTIRFFLLTYTCYILRWWIFISCLQSYSWEKANEILNFPSPTHPLRQLQVVRLCACVCLYVCVWICRQTCQLTCLVVTTQHYICLFTVYFLEKINKQFTDVTMQLVVSMQKQDSLQIIQWDRPGFYWDDPIKTAHHTFHPLKVHR